jgi:hypothetical protein
MIVDKLNENDSNFVIRQTRNFNNDKQELKKLIDGILVKKDIESIRLFYKTNFLIQLRDSQPLMPAFLRELGHSGKISLNLKFPTNPIYFHNGFISFEYQNEKTIVFNHEINKSEIYKEGVAESGVSVKGLGLLGGFFGRAKIKGKVSVVLTIEDGSFFTFQCHNSPTAETLNDKFNELKEQNKINNKKSENIGLEIKLKEIEELFLRGVLTEEEYKLKRKQIIESY